MDEHVRWLRQKIFRTVATRTVTLGVLVAVLAQTLMYVQRSPESSSTFLSLLPWSILIGQFVAGLQLVVSLLGNPLNYSYLKRFGQHPYRFVAVSEDGDLHPVVDELADWNLNHVVTVKDASTDEPPLFDLLQTPSRLVTAAIGRESGTVSLVSRLSDQRMLLTTNLLIPPRESLIINAVPHADAMSLAKRHVEVIHRLTDDEVAPVAAEASVFKDVMMLEHRSYHDLGPFLGCFCNVDTARPAHRLLVNVEPDDLLDLALA